MTIATQSSPPVEKRLVSLAPIFRGPFDAWLTAAREHVQHVEFRVTETRRTLARQDWLYKQGREAPYLNAPVVTWTLDSRHRWGLAADLAMIRKADNTAIWEVSSWQWLYRVVPPEAFGLRHLGPREWVHLEYRYADEAINEAQVVGLQRT